MKEVNLVEILKNVKENITLYSLVSGNVVYKKTYNEIFPNNGNPSWIITSHGSYTMYGHLFANTNTGECVLFPSKTCRDWSLFVRKGDILDTLDDYIYIQETGNLLDGVKASVYNCIHDTLEEKVIKDIHSLNGMYIYRAATDNEKINEIFSNNGLYIKEDKLARKPSAEEELLESLNALKKYYNDRGVDIQTGEFRNLINKYLISI